MTKYITGHRFEDGTRTIHLVNEEGELGKEITEEEEERLYREYWKPFEDCGIDDLLVDFSNNQFWEGQNYRCPDCIYTLRDGDEWAEVDMSKLPYTLSIDDRFGYGKELCERCSEVNDECCDADEKLKDRIRELCVELIETKDQLEKIRKSRSFRIKVPDSWTVDE